MEDLPGIPARIIAFTKEIRKKSQCCAKMGNVQAAEWEVSKVIKCVQML